MDWSTVLNLVLIDVVETEAWDMLDVRLVSMEEGVEVTAITGVDGGLDVWLVSIEEGVEVTAITGFDGGHGCVAVQK